MSFPGIIGTAEMKAPYALQVMCQAFRTPNQTKPLEGVLTKAVKMTAVGFINGSLNAFEGTTPEKVISLFRDIVAPAGARINGGSSNIEQNDDHTWTVEVYLSRTINDDNSNCLITAVCTLADKMISNIQFEVDPA